MRRSLTECLCTEELRLFLSVGSSILVSRHQNWLNVLTFTRAHILPQIGIWFQRTGCGQNILTLVAPPLEHRRRVQDESLRRRQRVDHRVVALHELSHVLVSRLESCRLRGLRHKCACVCVCVVREKCASVLQGTRVTSGHIFDADPTYEQGITEEGGAGF